MQKEHVFLVLACAFALMFLALFCYEKFFKKPDAVRPVVGVIDIGRVMQHSKPAAAARRHVEQAQKILQKAFDDVQAEWAGAPEAERNKVVQEAFGALNRQLESEKASAQKAVEDIMRAEISAWKKKSDAMAVASSQFLIEFDGSLDITDEIMRRMNESEPVFAELPKVEILKRPGPAPVPATEAPADQDLAKDDAKDGAEKPSDEASPPKKKSAPEKK